MTRPNRYYQGQPVRVWGRFQDIAQLDIDPQTVKMHHTKPDGTVVSYEFGTGDVIKRQATGVYYAEVIPSLFGYHYYCWQGEGTGAAAEEKAFYVFDTQGIPP